jgi:hypothetical protein
MIFSKVTKQVGNQAGTRPQPDTFLRLSLSHMGKEWSGCTRPLAIVKNNLIII